MTEAAKLIVEEGPSKGTEITVSPGMGLRIGRATGNDVPIPDPSVSRFHCRVFIRQDDGLWIADLGSANQTLVNDQPVREQKLKALDRIFVGDTVIKVISDGAASSEGAASPPTGPPATVAIGGPAAAAVEPAAAAVSQPDSGPVVDLGLDQANKKTAQKGKGPGRLIIIGVVTVVICVIIGLLITLLPADVITGDNGNDATTDFMPGNFALHYEKVVGSAEDIFWLSFTVEDDAASLELHDLKGTHFSESGRPVEKKAIDALAASIEKALFFNLKAEYAGQGRRNIYELEDLSVTVGTKTHRSRLLNTPSPEFDDVVRIVSAFSRVQFPECRQIDLSKEQLTKMAEEQWLNGQKLYTEKNVLRRNLALAINALRDSQNLVDSLDPKPDFYKDVVALRRTCEIEHKEACDVLRFDSDRAMRLDDWRAAAVSLRHLLDTVHDKNDPRYKQAEQDLIHVEDRMNSRG